MRRSSLVRILAAMSFVATATASAAVTVVTATPASRNVALNRSTSVNLTWSAATTSAGTVTVSSAKGEFRAPGGALLGTVAKPLSQTVTGPTTASFTEAILVPADVIQRAHKEGFDQLRYERSFTDGAAATGQITLHIATASAASFGITRLALAFDNGDALRVTARGEKLEARALLSYTGAGLLKGAWEIAGPNPDAAKPAWRAIAQVTQSFTGAETATLTSPPLPTDIIGPYLLRLRVREPALAADVPVIRFVVTEKNK